MSLVFVQGDTAPDIKSVLYPEGNTTDPIDLTDCEVLFQMRKPDDRRYTVNADAVIVDALTGQVSYSWGPNDLAVPGIYQAQWEIIFGDGKIQTTKTPLELEVRRQ